MFDQKVEVTAGLMRTKHKNYGLCYKVNTSNMSRSDDVVSRRTTSK